MFKTIVVATDGSELAARAVETAADLAIRCKARVHVVHALPRLAHAHLPPSIERFDEIERIHLAHEDVLRAGAEEIVDAAVARVREAGAAEVTSSVERGHPAKVIMAVAEREGADVIVMGSRGLTDAGGLLLGSVSHRVLHEAACPVLLVK